LITNLTPLEAQELIRDYVCNNCWGTLVEHYNPKTQTTTLYCATTDCPCDGLVSKGFVDRCKAESRAELSEARIALRDAVPWLRSEKKSTEQLLEELGF